MSMDFLTKEFQDKMTEMTKENDKTIGCHIKVDDDVVRVTIPNTESNENNIEDRVLTFSKREIKELLQDIYMS